MKLFISLTSPFARKTRIVMAEKRIECETIVDIPWDEDTQVPQYNPLGKVPVLVLDDGTSLYDSRVIVDYLDSVTPVSHLIPKTSRQRIAVKRWEALADGISDAAAAIFLERKRPEAQQNAQWMERQRKKIDRGLQTLWADLGTGQWCSGTTFNLADIAVGCALGYLDFRFPEISWRSEYPNLVQLCDKLAERQTFKDTDPRLSNL